jgi:hypothetical protein
MKMKMKPGARRKSLNSLLSVKVLAAAMATVVLLAGCATPTGSVDNETQAGIDAALMQADNEMVKGRRDQAIAVLTQAAKENPTSMQPWLKISNIWFEEGNYPSSILAANEVLERDSSNQEAKSILVVAGLRVAAGAARGLVSVNAASKNARKEAENLTNSLRVALGEPVLVPAVTPASKETGNHYRQKNAAHARPMRHVAAATPPVAKTAESQPTASASPDPFKSLK